jgi:flavodoxin
MKTLLVYYSLTQNNEQLSALIRERLRCDTLKIETVRKKSAFSIFLDVIFSRRPAIRRYETAIKSYDHLVLVCPIWMGKIAGPMRTFLQNEMANIQRYSFITLCGGIAGQKAKIQAELTSILGIPPSIVSELWISKVADENVPRDAKNISAYRVGKKDMEKFQTKIDEFCYTILEEKVFG